MKKYNILLVVRHPVGGIRTFFRYVYSNFDAERYHFTLIAPALPEALLLLKDLHQLNLDYIPTDQNVTNGQLFRVVNRTLHRGRFDLLHSHGFTSAVCSAPGALLTRVPHILTSHDVFTAAQFIGLKGVLRKGALAATLATTGRIHCVSHDARNNLLAYLWPLRLIADHIVVIENGIDAERLRQANALNLREKLGLAESDFLIGFLGRFMSQKGFKYLVNALALMLGRADLPKQPRVLTFGEDGFVREEKQSVEKMGLKDSVHFLPFVPDVASVLKGLDVVAIPSLWEACPLLPMEAMVAGVPVVGTNCVGLREVLRATPARIVNPQDSLGLSEALVAEMRNPTKVMAREFALEAAKRFDVKQRATELEQLMLRCLES